MARDTTLTWVEIDPTELSVDQQVAYQEYKESYKLMKAMREKFEQGMQTLAPEGKRLVFGYNFGKLSVAVVDKVAEKPKAQKQSLADYLKSQQSSGRAC